MAYLCSLSLCVRLRPVWPCRLAPVLFLLWQTMTALAQTEAPFRDVHTTADGGDFNATEWIATHCSVPIETSMALVCLAV